MSNNERQNQERGRPEDGAEDLKEKFAKTWDAIEEQASKTTGTIKEKTDRKYFRNKYIKAAVISLVLSGGFFGCAPNPKSQIEPVAAAGIEPREIVEKPVEEKPTETEKSSAEQQAELERLAEEIKKNDEQEFEKNNQEEIKRLKREIEALEPEVEKAPAEQPAPQEETDDEINKMEERMIITGLPKDVTYVRMPENWFAMDTGAIGANEHIASDFHCYKVTPEDLMAIKKAQEDYQAKVEKYILKRRPKFSGLLRFAFREAAIKEIKMIIRHCERIDETAPELVPDEIKKRQQERREQNEKINKIKREL